MISQISWRQCLNILELTFSLTELYIYSTLFSRPKIASFISFHLLSGLSLRFLLDILSFSFLILLSVSFSNSISLLNSTLTSWVAFIIPFSCLSSWSSLRHLFISSYSLGMRLLFWSPHLVVWLHCFSCGPTQWGLWLLEEAYYLVCDFALGSGHLELQRLRCSLVQLSVLTFVGWVCLPLVAAAKTGIKPNVVGVVPW